jgi:hypothetical protein
LSASPRWLSYWANGIADEPPPTEAEKRAGFGLVADVVEDDGSYDD